MKRRDIRSWLLALPALIALGAGYLFPLGIALYKSFFAGMSTNFVGLANYTDLFGNYAFGLALRNLLRLWCIAIPLNLGALCGSSRATAAAGILFSWYPASSLRGDAGHRRSQHAGVGRYLDL